MTRDELDVLHAESEAIGLIEATRQWCEALRAQLLAGMGPDAPPALLRAIERPGWTVDVLNGLRQVLAVQELYTIDLPDEPLIDPSEPRLTLTRAAFSAAMQDVATAAVRATVFSMLNTQKAAASAGAEAVNAGQKARAADLRARIRAEWLTPAAQRKPSLNAAWAYVAQGVGCSRSTVQSAVADLPHPKRVAEK